MTDVADLRDHIKSDLTLNGSDYDTQIVNAIYSALRQYRGKRFWFLKETDTTMTLLAGTNSVSLPANFGAPGEFEIVANGLRKGDDNGFAFYDYDRLKREYWQTSPLPTDTPEACAVANNKLYVDCLAVTDFTIYPTYYKKDSTLNLSTVSVWFDDGYDAIRTLAQYIFKRDAQGMTATEADGDMAQGALARLEETHLAREAGR